MTSHSRSGKNGSRVNINTFGLTAGFALVLGIYLIDLLMKTPALG